MDMRTNFERYNVLQISSQLVFLHTPENMSLFCYKENVHPCLKTKSNLTEKPFCEVVIHRDYFCYAIVMTFNHL